MSEKMIAASKLKRRIGCRVTSAAYSGEAKIEKAAGLGAQFAIFRQITAGLPHHPDRRHRLPVSGKDVKKGVFGVTLGQALVPQVIGRQSAAPDTPRMPTRPR